MQGSVKVSPFMHAAQRRIKSGGSPEWRKKALGGLVAPGNRAAGRISNSAEPRQEHVHGTHWHSGLYMEWDEAEPLLTL